MYSLKTDKTNDKLALEVLNILDRWDERLQGHHAQMRSHERKKYRRKIKLLFSENNQQSSQPQSLDVWCRNLSQNGLSFIYPSALAVEAVIVCLNPEAEEKLLYHAQVTRARQVHNGFWEYGVKLLDRVEI